MTIIFIVLALLVGCALGYLFVRNNQIIRGFVSVATTYTIYLLIFSMGLAVGTNQELIANVVSLGGQSIVLSLGAMLGSVLLAILFYHLMSLKKH